LLAPRRQERQVRKFNFFAAFAPLREIVRVLVAAQPRWVLRGVIDFCFDFGSAALGRTAITPRA
jgi:hypothetical protein